MGDKERGAKVGGVRDLKVAPGRPWTPQGFAKARLTVPAPRCPLSAGPGSSGLLTTCSNPKGRKRRGWGWFGKCHQLVLLEREGVASGAVWDLAWECFWLMGLSLRNCTSVRTLWSPSSLQGGVVI